MVERQPVKLCMRVQFSHGPELMKPGFHMIAGFLFLSKIGNVIRKRGKLYGILD